MHPTPSQALGVVVWLLACGVALWRGGSPERQVAAVLLVVMGTTLAVQDAEPVPGVQWELLVGDVVTLAALAVVLSRHLQRRWLAWAFAIQLVSVLSHIPKMIDPTIRIWGYATTVAIWGYGLLVALLWGALVESRKHGGGR